MKTTFLYLSFLAALTLSPFAAADEVWASTYGKVVYESDSGTTAVWNYVRLGIPGVIYIDNLAGVTQGRGFYQGYWVQPKSGVKCKTARKMRDKSSYYWGNFQIEFLDPNFPSRWRAIWNYCEKKPTTETWSGTPAN
jgi:hypothetical protein